MENKRAIEKNGDKNNKNERRPLDDITNLSDKKNSPLNDQKNKIGSTENNEKLFNYFYKYSKLVSASRERSIHELTNAYIRVEIDALKQKIIRNKALFDMSRIGLEKYQSDGIKLKMELHKFETMNPLNCQRILIKKMEEKIASFLSREYDVSYILARTDQTYRERLQDCKGNQKQTSYVEKSHEKFRNMILGFCGNASESTLGNVSDAKTMVPSSYSYAGLIMSGSRPHFNFNTSKIQGLRPPLPLVQPEVAQRSETTTTAQIS